MLKGKQVILRAIEQFDIHDRYPDGTSKGIPSKRSYGKLNVGFRRLIDNYASIAECRSNKTSSIYRISNEASVFFLAIQDIGFSRLEDVTEEAVLSMFISPTGEKRRGYNCKKAVSTVLKACANSDPETCNRILSYLPTIKCTRKNVQYLTELESTRIKEALDNMANWLSLRDRAIVKLAMYTGVRCSDIANMDIDSIDFERDRIIVKQQKTGVLLELPLSAVVGNAVYDYLTIERPTTNSPALFVSRNAPFRRLKAVSVGCVSYRIFEVAGIRQSKGDRKGLHIFRHRVATILVGNDVSQAVTSHILGQIAPTSTESYLSADFSHLKSCALSISRFPVQGEVFCLE
jgi:integrase